MFDLCSVRSVFNFSKSFLVFKPPSNKKKPSFSWNANFYKIIMPIKFNYILKYFVIFSDNKIILFSESFIKTF